MKIYEGTRTTQGCEVTVRDGDGSPRPLALRLDLKAHSPTGFEWNYTGSGPAQLALALLADVLSDDEQAQDYYQDLKFKLVSRLPFEGWRLTEDAIRQKLADIQRGQRSPAIG